MMISTGFGCSELITSPTVPCVTTVAGEVGEHVSSSVAWGRRFRISADPVAHHMLMGDPIGTAPAPMAVSPSSIHLNGRPNNRVRPSPAVPGASIGSWHAPIRGGTILTPVDPQLRAG
jgi:hypothetical protein